MPFEKFFVIGRGAVGKKCQQLIEHGRQQAYAAANLVTDPKARERPPVFFRRARKSSNQCST